MLSVWNPILSQGKETRPLNCWLTSCLTLHQIHSLTWHMACTAQEDEKSYLYFPSWRVTEVMPVWCADHSTCGHSTQWSVFFQIQKTKEYCQHHPLVLQCPGPSPSQDWQMFPSKEMVFFSFLPNDAYVLILKCKWLRMHPGDTLHIKNRSYQEWVLPEPPPPDLCPIPSTPPTSPTPRSLQWKGWRGRLSLLLVPSPPSSWP